MTRPTLHLLRLLSLRHFRRHALRTGLALASVALGVAAFLGMAALNRGVLDSFERTARLRAGGADLVLRGGGGGIPRELAAEAARLPGVRAAVPAIARFLEVVAPKRGRVLLLGVDPEAMPPDVGLMPKDAIAELASPLALLRGGEPVFLTASSARELALRAGDEFTVAAPDGTVRARVVGLLREEGELAAFGGVVAAARLESALALTARSGLVDRVQVFLESGADVAAARAALAVVAAGRAEVVDPLASAREYDATIGSFRLALQFLALLSLLIAAFLVHSTLSMALAERRRELSIARCLGLAAARVRALLVSEAVAVGALGALLGVPLGHLFARGMSALFWTTVGGTFDRIDVVATGPSWGEAAVGFAAGLVAAVVAVAPAAFAAARRPALEGLRAARMEEAAPRRTAWPLIAAVALAGSAVAAFACDGFGLLHAGYAVSALMVGAVTLGAHPALKLALRGTGPLLLRWLGPAGRLARDHCDRAAGPTSLTVVAISLGFGLIYATDVLVRSYEVMLDDWFEVTVGEDLFVMGEDFLTSGLQGTSFAADFKHELAAIPGVLHVHALCFSRIPFRGERILLLSLDGAAPPEAGRAIYIDGSDADRAAFARGEGVFVSEGFARRFGCPRGSTVDLPAPTGRATLPVLAVVADYSWPRGVVWIDDDFYRRLFADDQVQEFGITLDASRSRADVKQDVELQVRARYPAIVLGIETVQGTVMEIFRRYWRLLLAQESLAAMVAFLGTLHTLLISVLLRRREIAVLRALGAPLAMLGSMFRTEGVLLGLAGGTLGVLFGIGTATTVLRMMSLEEQGFAVAVRPSLLVALFTIAAAGATGWLAGFLPGRMAARTAPRTALLDTMA